MTGMRTASSQLSLHVCNTSCYYQWTPKFRKLWTLWRVNGDHSGLWCGRRSSPPVPLLLGEHSPAPHRTAGGEALPAPASPPSALGAPIPPRSSSLSALAEPAGREKHLKKSWKAAGKLAGQFTLIASLTAPNPLRWRSTRLPINCEVGRCNFPWWV